MRSRAGGRAEGAGDGDRPPCGSSTSGRTAPTWERTVGMFAGAVGRGRIDKVVLARRVTFEGPADLDVVARAATSRGRRPREHDLRVRPWRRRRSSARRRSDCARTVGRSFETVAIAGSAPRGADPAEDARFAAGLLASEKDREEHAVVVDTLRAASRPIAETLTIADSPGDPAAPSRPAPRDADHRDAARRGRAARPGRPAAPDARGRRRRRATSRSASSPSTRTSIAAGTPARSAGSAPMATAS